MIYNQTMKKTFFSVFLALLTFGACGNGNEVNEEIVITLPDSATYDTEDLISFTQPDSEIALQMDFNAKNVKPQKSDTNDLEAFVWEDPIRIINNTCGGFSSERNSPIYLLSPDGARLGQIDETWEPNWSPDGRYVALACGRDDDNRVVVVTDTEHQGSSKGWSRTERGSLSDQMEIWVISPDGSELKQITANNYGDWLPRWAPKNSEDFSENVFFNTTQWPDMLLVESNRDGNSEIYLHVTNGTESWRITNSETQEQSPAWSRDGNAAVFSSNKRIKEFGISFNLSPFGQLMENTNQVGRPIPWD